VHFFVFVLVLVNEFIIFSFLPILFLVFVNENHTDTYKHTLYLQFDCDISVQG